MPYIGNQAVVGDSANTFKLLDDIVSFTVTFDATDSGVVSIANNTLTFNNHRFVTGQKVTYNDGGGTAIGGLSDGSYFIIKEDQSTIKLASSASNATSGTAIDLTSGAAGGSHTLNIAQDGVNTKFKATHTNGIKAKVSRPAQISLSINGVIQAPNDGYSIESDSTIVFSSAPEATDKIFASFIGEVAASFDLSDNTVDEFTANGSTTTFTLSKTVPSSNDVLVTLDGVTQYPNTQSATRAYSVLENVLTFTSAPAAGVIIQARHIGFSGASSQSVTGFYGRTGNVQLKNTDNVAVNNLTVAGNLDVTGDLTYDETVSRNLNVTGVATVASGIVSTGDWKIGTATTLSQDNIFTTGIITATSFVGSGANLTGVASTENIRTNTNATFLQNVTVVGTSTVTGNIVPSSDSATDIGTNSVRFQNAYVDTYYGDGSNLTGIAATANVRTGILDVAGIATFRSTVNVSNINDGQIGGRRNLLINGAMRVNQRVQTGSLGYFNPVTSSIYTLDRWKVLNSNSFDTDSAQVTQANGTTINGFRNSIMMNIGNTETPGANQVCGFEQKIEAQDLHGLKYGTSSAETMTLSFWVYTNKTGTYCVQLIQDDATKYVLYEYTVSASNTWEKKTITIVGNTADVINDDNGVGLNVNWILCCGSGRHVSATSSWASGGSYYATSNQVNLWDHADNYFRMTGCQLEVGTTATEYEHRSYGDELLQCQRYYYRHSANNNEFFRGMAMADVDGNSIELNSPFPTTMRIAPTAIEQTGTAANYKIRRSTTATCTSVPSFGHATTDQLQCRFTASSHGFGDGSAVRCASGTAGAYIGVSAEL